MLQVEPSALGVTISTKSASMAGLAASALVPYTLKASRLASVTASPRVLYCTSGRTEISFFDTRLVCSSFVQEAIIRMDRGSNTISFFISLYHYSLLQMYIHFYIVPLLDVRMHTAVLGDRAREG